MVISRVGETEIRATEGGLVLTAVLAAFSALRLGAWGGLTGAALIVISLVLHEVGHLAMAQALGIRVKAVGLCLKGAYIHRSESRRATSELLIAISGPLANLLLYYWLRDGAPILRWVAVLNLVLVISNLAPLPGTDGARIFQSLQSLARGKVVFISRNSGDNIPMNVPKK